MEATQYQSGDELHIDYTVAQHFSEAFGIGVTGYYYNQLTDDESPQLDQLQQVVNNVNALRQVLGREALPSVGGFRGEALGIDPIVRYSPKFGDKQVHFIGKWIHEFDVKNRLEGEIGMLSVALDFERFLPDPPIMKVFKCQIVALFSTLILISACSVIHGGAADQASHDSANQALTETT